MEMGGWDKLPTEGKANGTFRIAVGSRERQAWLHGN